MVRLYGEEVVRRVMLFSVVDELVVPLGPEIRQRLSDEKASSCAEPGAPSFHLEREVKAEGPVELAYMSLVAKCMKTDPAGNLVAWELALRQPLSLPLL